MLIDGAIAKWHDRTFDPDKHAEHRKQQEQAQRSRALPPALPPIVEIAMRPAGAQTLTSLFRKELPTQEAQAEQQLVSLAELDAFIASL